MAPTTLAKPFHRPSWVYEEKYEGCMLAVHDSASVVTRNGAGHTERFQHIAAEPEP